VSDECLSASVAFDIGSHFAVRVGSRRGKPIVLQVDAGKMHDAGFQFFLSVNGVWLIDSVPAVFLVRL
jgi:putative RNA 2'-phosphotransferase